MAVLLKGINSVEGLIAVILMMGFVLILAGPVRRALSGSAEEEQSQTIKALGAVADAVKANTAVNEIQNKHFEANNLLFTGLQKTTASIEGILRDVLNETIRGKK